MPGFTGYPSCKHDNGPDIGYIPLQQYVPALPTRSQLGGFTATSPHKIFSQR
jgi:hypothetical protein